MYKDTYDMLSPIEGEDFHAFAIRLYDNAKEYKLNVRDIADILNKKSGTNKDESAWRKYYAAFRHGISYAKNNASKDFTKILALSDFHYPFNLPISTFSRYRNPDILVLNGDILDCQSISKFPKNYRIPIKEELVGARQYLIDLIEYVSPKEVYITVGNHEARLGKYLASKIDTDVIELLPDTALDYIVTDGFYNYDKRQHTKVWYEPIQQIFDNITINYDGDWKVKIGKTIFAHPLAYSSSTMKTSEKAANFFFRTSENFDTIVLAHTHQLGFYIQGNINLYEQGTCSDIEQLDYQNGKLTNPQQKGFLYLVQDKDGNNIVKKTELISLK